MKIFRTACLLGIVVAFLAASAAFAQGYMLKPAGKIGGASGWVSFLAFSPDGSRVASNVGGLSIWTFPRGHLAKQIAYTPQEISPDWAYYASQQGVGRLTGGDPIVSATTNDLYTFSADSRLVAMASSESSGQNTTIKIIHLPSGRQIDAFGSASAFSLAFSPDERTLAEGHWDSVTLWNFRTGTRIATFRGFGRYVDSLSFSPDGKFLAGGTDFGTLQIWDVHRRMRMHVIALGGQYVSKPAFSPSGKLLAVGVYGTGEVSLIDVPTGTILDHKKVSDMGCGSVAFSPDGRYLITPSMGGGLVIWPHHESGTIGVFRVVRR